MEGREGGRKGREKREKEEGEEGRGEEGRERRGREEEREETEGEREGGVDESDKLTETVTHSCEIGVHPDFQESPQARKPRHVFTTHCIPSYSET